MEYSKSLAVVVLMGSTLASLLGSTIVAAQTVTVYGNIDLSVMTARGTYSGQQVGSTLFTGVGVDGSNTAAITRNRGPQSSMVSGNRSTSKIGFKGTEDLGGGNKVGFVIESGFDASGATGQASPAASGTSGAGLLGNREISVNWENDSLGSFKVGSMKNKFLDSFGNFDANTNTGAGAVGNVMYNPLTSKSNNSILYVSPSFSGLTAAYQVDMSENQDGVSAPTSGSRSTVSAYYNNGPIGLMAGQTIARDYAATVLGKTFTVNQVGGSYDFGVAKLMGQYFTTKNTMSGAETARTIDATTYNIGATVPYGPFLGRVAYSATNDKRTNDADVSQWYLGADYNLSKRTTLYAGAATVTNKNGAMFSANTDTTSAMTGVIPGSLAAGSAATGAAGGRTNAVLMGVNTRF